MMGLSGNNSAATTGDPSFSSVVFLAGWEGSNGATTYNEEKNSRAGSFSGNAQITTAQFKFGASSLVLDGTGDEVTFTDNADWTLSSGNSDQFTIEMFVRFNSTSSSFRGLIRQWGTIGNRSWALELTSADTTNLTFTFSTDGSASTTVATASAGLTTATWYAITVEKDATGKIRIYVDGTMRGSSTPGNSAFFNSSSTLDIGVGTTTLLNGWLDEVRITKGVARYASDGGYTVRTTAFPRS